MTQSLVFYITYRAGEIVGGIRAVLRPGAMVWHVVEPDQWHTTQIRIRSGGMQALQDVALINIGGEVEVEGSLQVLQRMRCTHFT